MKSLCVDNYVSYKGNVVDVTVEANILAELYSQKRFSDQAKGTDSLWITDSNLPYEWESAKVGTIRKPAVRMSDFKSVEKLMTKLNSEYHTSYNSCLVQFYRDGSSGVRLHEDLEHTIDNNHSIGVVSLGAERRVEFLNNYQVSTEVPAKTISVKNGSLYVMEAKCQQFFRHRVPSCKEVTSPRFSLSFRRFLTPSGPAGKCEVAVQCESVVTEAGIQCETPTPIKEQIKHFENLCTQTSPIKQPCVTVPGQHRPPPPSSCPDRHGPPTQSAFENRDITVLFGTSITRRLDCSSLSYDRTEFVNVSVGGARIHNAKHFNHIPDMGTLLENFATMNKEKAHRVKTIVFSVGTNDIKFLRKDMGRGNRAMPGDMGAFYQPLSNLVKSARYFFGKHVEIIFQSVIPMKCMYTYTADNFVNFNILLQSLCHDCNCGYFDVFDYFLDNNGFDYNSNLYADPFHLNRNGIPVLENCFKAYLTALRNYRA